MCGTKAFRGLPESDSCVHFRTQARTGVSAPVSPLHLVPTTCGPSACRTQALSCPLPVCSTASPGPLPAPDQPLGAAYSAGLSLPHVCASCRSPSISSIPANRFTSFALSGIQTPILCKGFHDIHLFITPSPMYKNREGKYVIQREASFPRNQQPVRLGPSQTARWPPLAARAAHSAEPVSPLRDICEQSYGPVLIKRLWLRFPTLVYAIPKSSSLLLAQPPILLPRRITRE